MSRPSCIEVVENIATIKQVMHRSLEPLLKQHTISAQQWHMLRMIQKQSNGVTTTELAEAAQITSGAVSQFINQLDEMGYINRRQQRGDRRITILTLTSKSAQLLHTLKAAMRKVLDESFSCLSDQELKDLMDLLKKVGNHVKQTEETKYAAKNS